MVKNSLDSKRSPGRFAGQFVPTHLRKRNDKNKQAGRHDVASLDFKHKNVSRPKSLMKINDSYEFYDYE